MEPLFENKYNRTKEDYKELYIRKYITNPFVIFACIVLIAYLIYGIVSKYYNAVYISVVFLIAFFILFLKRFRLAKINYSRILEVNNGKEVEVITTAFDDKLICDSSLGNHLELSYDKVKKTFTTKNLIAVVTNSKLAYILRKDSFTKGTPDEFIAFINSKINSNR